MSKTPTSDVAKQLANQTGAVIVDNSADAVKFLLAESGPPVVCIEIANTPLTQDEKDTLLITMGGPRQGKTLKQILSNRGGVPPSDWEEMVLKQGIWFKKK